MNGVLELNMPRSIAARHASIDRALRVDGVSKRFGGPSRFSLPGRAPAKIVTAIDDVSLSIKRGEIFGVLGGNGSGKSTLIRLIATLLLPDAGRITVFDYDVVEDAAEVRRMLNRVSVEASLFKKLSAMENLMYAARLYGVETRAARKEIFRILDALGIPESRVLQPVEKMSRGMQQKVSIARALLTSPVLLLLDEPTTGLDPRSKKDVQQFILDLRQTHDATVLLTSHDMDEADALCDRLAIVEGGQIVVEGTPQALKAAHARQQGIDTVPSLEDVFMAHTGRSLSEDDEGGGE